MILGLCKWENTTLIRENPSWVIKKANANDKLTGPKVDGSGAKNGSYLIYKQSIFSAKSNPAKLISNQKVYQFKKSQFGCVMTFDYYMTDYRHNTLPINSNPIELGVRIKYSFDEYAQIWRKTGDQGSKWQKATVFIDENMNNFAIQITGYYFGINKTIAIDNIKFSNCSTPKAQTQCSNDQIQCPKTKVCVNKYASCDGINDCGNPLDPWEEKPSNCSSTIRKCTFSSKDNWNNHCNLTIINSGTKSKWTVQAAEGEKGKNKFK